MISIWDWREQLMDWTELPEFDEKFAKIKIREHKTFGGKVIEVLYGATDENGNPVLPREDAQDGHGRWFGIDINGEHRMFSLQKPASAGGEIEYTTDSKENALEDMESTILKKQDLCRRADAVLKGNAPDAKEAMEALKEEWNSLTDWNTPREEEFANRFNSLFEEYDAIQDRFARNAAEKQSIVEQALSLTESTEWKNTQAKFRELSSALREIGSAGHLDDEIEAKFREALNAFNTKRREYFDNLDTIRAAAKEKKAELIEEASKIAAITNFKQAGDKLNELMTQWKAAGSAGHETDEELWEKFNALRKDFFDRRRAFFEERELQRQQSIEAKNALIEEARKLAASNDFSKEVTDRMKELDKEWKATGFSGKEEGDRLWNTFKEAKEVFWNGKHADSQKRFQDIITRKNDQIAKLREEIDDLGVKEFETDVYDEIRSIQRRIEEKKSLVDSLEADVEGLKEKLDK